MARIFRDNPIAIAEGSSGSPAIKGLNPGEIQTASSSAALTFVNLPGADFIEFEICGLKPATAGATLQMQVSKDNGSNWTTSYIWSKQTAEIASSGGGVTDSTEGVYGDSKVILSKTSGGVGNGSNSCVSGVVRLISPGSASVLKQLTWNATHANNSTSGYVSVTGGGLVTGIATTEQINAVKFFFSTGNITNGKVVLRARRSVVTN